MSFVADLFTANADRKAQTKAADKAAAASQYATDQTLALQKEMNDKIWASTQGARDLGDAATKKLLGLTDGSVDPTAWVEATPGYKVNLDAGQRQINASAAAKGRLLSGAAAREGLKYGADYATGVLNNERNALYTAAGLGANGVSTGAATGQATTNASTNALQGNAANLGTSYQKKADATSGFWGSVNASINNTGNTLAKAFAGF